MQKKKGKTTIPPLLTFNLKVGFTFSVLSPWRKQQFISALETCQRHIPTLWRYRFGKFDTVFYQEFILSSGVFRRRRAVFILGATWNTLVRGRWRDCVVGGMETRFQ